MNNHRSINEVCLVYLHIDLCRLFNDKPFSPQKKNSGTIKLIDGKISYQSYLSENERNSSTRV